MTVFTKDGKAFVKNASGRITDIPASQLEIFTAQGYIPCTEEEVKAVLTFKHVFDGNYGQNAKIDNDTLTAMSRLQSGQVAQIAERLRDGSDIAHGELMIGAEPHPPMTSRTKDGFPRLQEAGVPHVGIRPSAQPAAPTLQRGQVPDNLREAIGRVTVGEGVKDPEQAIRDGDVQVIVASPVQSVSVASRPLETGAVANVAAARAAVSGGQAALGNTVTEALATTAGGTVTVVRPGMTAVDNTPTLQAIAVASAVAGEKAKQVQQQTQQAIEAGREAVQELATGEAGEGQTMTMQEAADVAAQQAAQPQQQAEDLQNADSGEGKENEPKGTAPAETELTADSPLPEGTPRLSAIQKDGRIKTVGDLLEFDFAKNKIEGVAEAGVKEIEAFRKTLAVE